MPQTPLGQLHRSNKGQFLYGRPANYRLRPCLAMAPVTYVNDKLHQQLMTVSPTLGPAVLAVTFTALNTNYATFPVADQWLNWPTTNNQTADRIKTGGYLYQGAARFYPRVSTATPVKNANTPTWNIDFGDGTAATGDTAGFNTATVHNYTATDNYNPSVILTDALGRTQTDTEYSVIAAIMVGAITSAEAFGTITLDHKVFDIGAIASAEAVEAPTVA